jgi:hypothetical protein
MKMFSPVGFAKISWFMRLIGSSKNDFILTLKKFKGPDSRSFYSRIDRNLNDDCP